MDARHPQSAGLGKTVWIIMGVALLMLCSLGGAVAYVTTRVASTVGRAADDQQRRLKAVADQRRELEQQRAKLERDVRESEAKQAALAARLAAAKDDAARRAIQKELDAEAARAPGATRPRSPACNCAPGDPLCSCL